MKKNLFIFLLGFTAQAYSTSGHDALQLKLNAIRSMTAHFNQVVKAQKREVSRSSGTMALLRPGHFRWQTQDPLAQLLIADGRHLWIYDVDLEQVTVKKQDKALDGAAGLFLSGYNDTLARDFDVTVNIEGNKNYFDLHAKSSKTNFQRVKLMFEGEALTGIELFDQLGQDTDVHLDHIKLNPELVKTLFEFKIPKGVDVVEQ